MLDLDGYKSVIILSLITILFASPFTTAISHINLISRRFYRLFCWYCSLLALPGSLLSKVRLYTKCANLLFLDWISEQPWLSHTQGGERNYFRESLISTTYFTLLVERTWLFTKSRKRTTLQFKNRGLYFVLGLMMYIPLDKWKLVFCAAVQI